MLFLALVFFWIVGTIWGYRRAVRAGYSEVTAGLAALFLGFFAPLLGFVKPDGKKCRFCETVIPTAASVCRSCAREQ